MAKIAGAYTATYTPAGGSAGSAFTSETGFHLIETMHHQNVADDAYGDVPVDGIQQGCTVMVRFEYIDYDLVLPAIYAQNTQGSSNANVGKTLSGLAGLLLLTAVTGTPAHATGLGITYTFYKAIVVGDLDTLLSSKLRKGPLTFQCFPDPGHSNLPYAVT